MSYEWGPWNEGQGSDAVKVTWLVGAAGMRNPGARRASLILTSRPGVHQRV